MAVAYRNSSSYVSTQNNNFTIAVPSGTTTNDITIIVVYPWWATDVFTATPVTVTGGNGTWYTGYTYEGADPGSGIQVVYLAWKRATSADSGTYSVAINTSPTTTVWTAAHAISFSGVDTGITDVYETVDRQTVSSGTANAAVSVTTANSDPIILHNELSYNPGAHTPPTNWTEVQDPTDLMALSYRLPAATGTYATTGATGTHASGGSTSVLFAIKGAGAAPPAGDTWTWQYGSTIG